MKVYISADMEGTSGVVHPDQTEPGRPEYPLAAQWMLGEVNAAVEGAVKGGATRVLVNDSHWFMRNLPIDGLHPAAELLSGSPKLFSMMEGIDAGFDAVFFTGYHARAGSVAASIDHTYDGPNTVQNIWLNEVEVGEYGLNAALAGYFDVPVALLTGDQTACAQAKQLLGDDLETVAVKQAVSRSAAINLHPTKVHTMIRDAAERALKKKRAPFALKSPVTLRLALAHTMQADQCMLIPNVQRIAPRVVELRLDDYATLFKAFRAMLILADVNA